MANKTLFKSLIGKLMPATDALNEERAPAYALSPKHHDLHPFYGAGKRPRLISAGNNR